MPHVPEGITQEQLTGIINHALSLFPIEVAIYPYSLSAAEQVRYRSKRAIETGIITDDDYIESEPEPETDPINIWDISNYEGQWVIVEDQDEQFRRLKRLVAYRKDTPIKYIDEKLLFNDVPLAVSCHGLYD